MLCLASQEAGGQGVQTMHRKITGLAIAAIATVLLAGCGAATDTGSSAGVETPAETQSTGVEPESPAPSTSGPELSVSQQQAMESAASYIESGSFSEKGLAKQLVFEGFSKKEAAYAAKNVGADYQQEANEAAASYLESGSFSEKGLNKQLVFEGFTKSQAAAGVKSTNADWNAEAAEAAASYLETSSFSKSGLTKQLLFEGFTASQAAAGVKAAGL